MGQWVIGSSTAQWIVNKLLCHAHVFDSDPELLNSVRNFGLIAQQIWQPTVDVKMSAISRLDGECLRNVTRHGQTENSIANCDHFDTLLILLLVVDGLGSSTALNVPLVAGVETLLEG